MLQINTCVVYLYTHISRIFFMAQLDEILTKLDTTLTALLGKLGGDGSTIGGSGTGASGGGTTVGFDPAIYEKAGTVLGQIASNGGGVVSVFKAIGDSKDPVLDALKTLAQISKIPGAQLSVDLIAQRSQANLPATSTGKDTDILKQGQQELNAGKVSYADFQKMMSQNQTGLTGAGGIQNDRTDNLYKTLQQLVEKNKEAIAAGATTPDALARALIQSQQRQTTNVATPEGRNQAVMAAQKLATEIDGVAKRTGESREVIAEQNAKRLAEGDQQATLALLSTNQQRQAYIKAQASMAGMGEDYQKLAKEYVQFGAAISPEAQAKQLALGPAAKDLRDAMIRLKGATTENARAEAEAAVEKAKASANERQRDPRVARMAIMANAFPEEGALLGGFKRGYEQNREAAGYDYNRNTGMSPDGATGAIRTQVGNLQGGLQQSGANPTEAMRLQGAILEGNISAAQGAATAMGKLNTELQKNPGITQTFIDGIRNAAKLPIIEKPTIPQPAPQPAPPPIRPPGQAEPLPPRPGGATREHGTLGTTGSTFEPKDIFSLIHKGERVLSPSENADLTNLFGMVSDLKPKSDLGGALSTVKPQTEDTTEVAEDETSKATGDTVADSSGITLKDLNDSLQQLNSNIELMVSHTADMKDSTRETADMSGKMTGNRFAV
jgi:hypothetical protein